jgi:hypothetical protein
MQEPYHEDEIDTAHTFTAMGAYNPAIQGPITGLDVEFDFKTFSNNHPSGPHASCGGSDGIS